ncbi:Uncharacterized protein dnm_027960 [Desulfonema magnum]|uniref:Uncharacterized protein n=1 Tax=Desulfonema magnum TaxID=45655 RepID=A0A975GMG3_9BACT|nr:Uncharacterized protein dnm_027960 [Desulfonema magnum]
MSQTFRSVEYNYGTYWKILFKGGQREFSSTDNRKGDWPEGATYFKN